VSSRYLSPVSFRFVLEENSHRCRSLLLFSTRLEDIRVFFPLPVRIPVLTNLVISTTLQGAGEGDIFSLFHDYENPDFSGIDTLTLSASRTPTRSDRVLRVLSLFPHLRTLEVRGEMRAGSAPHLPIAMPNVRSITMDCGILPGRIMLLNFITAPRLRHLSLIQPSTLITSPFNSLRTLHVDFIDSESAIPLMEFACAHNNLVAIHFLPAPQCISVALERLNDRSSAQRDRPADLPCPSLQFLRISRIRKDDMIYPSYGYDRLAKNLRQLLE
jgi:hypothetical protein